MNDEQVHRAADQAWFLLQGHPPMHPALGSAINEKLKSRHDHVLLMVPRIKSFLAEGRREKAMRWLGFVQGYMWTKGLVDIVDIKEHNRSHG